MNTRAVMMTAPTANNIKVNMLSIMCSPDQVQSLALQKSKHPQIRK
jgi:hypothetical protein